MFISRNIYIYGAHIYIYSSPACLDYFSLDEFTPLRWIYAFPDTGTPQVPNTLGLKTTQVFGPKTSRLRKLSSSISAWWRVDDEKKTRKRLIRIQNARLLKGDWVYQLVIKVLGRAGGGKFFYWKHGQNWRTNIIKYCANSTKSHTATSPTTELLQLPRNMPVSAYKLYSSCSYSILSYSSLSYSTLSLCTFHFQVMIFKSPEPKSFSTKLPLRIQKWTEKSYKWEISRDMQNKSSPSWLLVIIQLCCGFDSFSDILFFCFS